MFFVPRACCCGLNGSGGGEGGDFCLYCWSLSNTCSGCPDGGESGGNGPSGCDPSDATCEEADPNGSNDCIGCTYTYNESESTCYLFSLCPCIWVCEHPGCTTTPGGLGIPCPKVIGCPEVIDNRLQCPGNPCPGYEPECSGCSDNNGNWVLIQDPYISTESGNAEPTCFCCCQGHTGTIIDC